MSRRTLARRLGLTGAFLGGVAGLIQAVAGQRLPEWTGDKRDTVGLGLLTISLAVAAGLAAHRQCRPNLGVLPRAACAVVLLGSGLLGLTTVGRLWYLPATLLVVAGAMTVDTWDATARALRSRWAEVLLTALAACQLLMVAVAPPLLTAFGAASAGALLVLAWTRPLPPLPTAVLAIIAVVPPVVLGWTAVVPADVALEAALLLVPVVRSPERKSHV